MPPTRSSLCPECGGSFRHDEREGWQLKTTKRDAAGHLRTRWTWVHRSCLLARREADAKAENARQLAEALARNRVEMRAKGKKLGVTGPASSPAEEPLCATVELGVTGPASSPAEEPPGATVELGVTSPASSPAEEPPGATVELGVTSPASSLAEEPPGAPAPPCASRRVCLGGEETLLVRWLKGHAYAYRRECVGLVRAGRPRYRDTYVGRIDDVLARSGSASDVATAARASVLARKATT